MQMQLAEFVWLGFIIAVTLSAMIVKDIKIRLTSLLLPVAWALSLTSTQIIKERQAADLCVMTIDLALFISLFAISIQQDRIPLLSATGFQFCAIANHASHIMGFIDGGAYAVAQSIISFSVIISVLIAILNDIYSHYSSFLRVINS